MIGPLALRDLLALAGLLLLALGIWALARRHRARRWGAPVAFDDGPRAPVEMVSEAWGLRGRPDQLRRGPSGTLIPVELKSRPAPRGPVFASHRVQVEAYCLLVESTTGRSPPYGVLAYSDGIDRVVPWNAEARAEVVGLLREVRQRYDGRAAPSPGKCAGCRWRPGCDARA